MLQHFKHLYSDTIRTEVMRRFGLTPISLDILPDASHSYVYDCKRDGKSYILKITHTIHRRPNHILGELEFINFLADGGVTVPRAVPSLSGNLVESVAADEGEFIVVAFEKAEGSLVDWRTWTPQMFEQWGALIGKMHALTKNYQPSTADIRRRFWHQDFDWNTDADVYRGRPAFREKARGTRDWLMSLPTDQRLLRSHPLRPAPVELLLPRRPHPAIRLRQHPLRLVHIRLHHSHRQRSQLPAVPLRARRIRPLDRGNADDRHRIP